MTQRQVFVVLLAVFTASISLSAEGPEMVITDPAPLRPSQPQEWQAIGMYLSEGTFWRPNPLHKFAGEYFELYLTERPSPHASEALKQAFNMWSYVEGGSLKIREALEKVSPDEEVEVWTKVGYAVSRSFRLDQIEDQGQVLLEQLAEKVQSQEAKGAILSQLAFSLRSSGGQNERTREILEYLVETGSPVASRQSLEWSLRQTKNRPIGSIAPDFAVNDLDGNPVSLSSLRGKVVVLFFWGTWCGWCKPGYPYLRALAHQFDAKDLAIVSISYNDDEAKLRAAIDEEDFNWINIAESEKDHPIMTMYDVVAWPSIFVIDREGYFAKSGWEMRLYTVVSHLIQK